MPVPPCTGIATALLPEPAKLRQLPVRRHLEGHHVKRLESTLVMKVNEQVIKDLLNV